MPTAKDFTMIASGINMYSNPRVAFGWIIDGSTEALAMYDNNIRAFVRAYARDMIETWRDSSKCKANESTIYKVWRAGHEFDLIVTLIENEIKKPVMDR
jgi:hypothetical protein